MKWRCPAMVASLAWLASCSAPDSDVRLLLLLSVDTLRADRIGAYGSDLGLTPRLDALAAGSQRFALAYAPSSHTLPSVTTLLTGRYPEELGVWSNGSVLPPGTPTLATTLRASGWRTAAVVSNWVVRAESGLDAGFELYDDALPELERARPLPERVADDTTAAALRALDACLPERASRCFLWVHYQDPHGPYTPPPGWRERHLARERARPDGRRQLPLLDGPFGAGGIPSYQQLDGEREVAFYRAGYDGEVAYLDAEIGRLLDGLRERGLFERTLLVFTADHGESLGEDDVWFGHGETLSEPLVRVPLLLRGPGMAAGVRDDLATLADVAPTLWAQLLDAPPDPALPGRSLLQPVGGESRAYLAALRGAKLPRIGLVEGEFKYLMEQRDGIWHGRLLRRDDPSADLTAAAPQLAQRMRQRLLELARGYRRTEEESLAPVDEVGRARLQALGYLE